MGDSELFRSPHVQIRDEDLDRVHPEFGIPLRIFSKAVRDGAAGRATVSRHHFRSEAGHRERADRIASLVESATVLGGGKIDKVGVLLPCRQRVVLTMRGNRHTGASTAISPACTTRTGRAVLRAMEQLRAVRGKHEVQLANPSFEFWVLLVHYDRNTREYTAEVSRPNLVDGQRLVGFDRRLLLPAYRPQSIHAARRRSSAARASSEVKVKRRRKSS